MLLGHNLPLTVHGDFPDANGAFRPMGKVTSLPGGPETRNRLYGEPSFFNSIRRNRLYNHPERAVKPPIRPKTQMFLNSGSYIEAFFCRTETGNSARIWSGSVEGLNGFGRAPATPRF